MAQSTHYCDTVASMAKSTYSMVTSVAQITYYYDTVASMAQRIQVSHSWFYDIKYTLV